MKKQLIRFIIFSYVVLLTGLLIPYTKSFFLVLSSYYILLIIGLIVYYARYTRTIKTGKRQLFFFIGVMLLTIWIERYVAPVYTAVHSFVPVDLSDSKSIVSAVLVGINWSFIIYCSATICFSIRNKLFHVLAASFLVTIYYFLLAQVYVVVHQTSWPSIKLVDLSFQFIFIFSAVIHSFRLLFRIQVKNALANATYIVKTIGNAVYILVGPLIG